MRKILIAAAFLAISGAAWGQGVPNSSTVVSSCGTPPTTYAAGQNKANLQDTNGYQCTNGTVSGTVSLGSGTEVIGKVGIDQTTAGTSNGVIAIPSSAAAAGVAPTSTTALAANLVAKASAGNLYSFEVAADSTLSGGAWWLMVYDATSAPADGSVTPAKCYALASGTTRLSEVFRQPIYFATGIVLGVSTNGCFTKAASTHAFMSADVK